MIQILDIFQNSLRPFEEKQLIELIVKNLSISEMAAYFKSMIHPLDKKITPEDMIRPLETMSFFEDLPSEDMLLQYQLLLEACITTIGGRPYQPDNIYRDIYIATFYMKCHAEQPGFDLTILAGAVLIRPCVDAPKELLFAIFRFTLWLINNTKEIKIRETNPRATYYLLTFCILFNLFEELGSEVYSEIKIMTHNDTPRGLFEEMSLSEPGLNIWIDVIGNINKSINSGLVSNHLGNLYDFIRDK